MANHAIFLAPYTTKGSSAQIVYDAAMEQAIGRIKRQGQTKTVYSVVFCMAYTIDVDIYEMRNQQVICGTGGHSWVGKAAPYEGAHGQYRSRMGEFLLGDDEEAYHEDRSQQVVEEGDGA